ncbi:MAG: two-component regulator propeller domain-containing protein, partial [Nostoc sp.]
GKIISRVSLPSIAIGALAQDKVGRLWVGSSEGLIRVDPRTNEITAQNLFLPSKRVLSLLLDKRGYLWTGTDNGLALISPDQGLIMTTLKNLPGVSANT